MLSLVDVREQRSRPPAGYSLLEIVVVLAALAIVAGLGFPLVQNVVHRTQVRSALRDITNLMQLARLESIRFGSPTVVMIDEDSGEVIAFVDVHGDPPTNPSDGLFNPDEDAEPRTTDWEIRRVSLAGGLMFRNPEGQSGLDSVFEFLNPAPLPIKRTIFRNNGSAAAEGAFRLADQRNNFFEIRVRPAATGKFQVRKFDNSLDVNWDGTYYYAEGEMSQGWNWN